MKITEIPLSDGRELRYYDADGAPARDRGRPARAGRRPRTESELRYDPLLAQWIMVASHRQSRTYKPSTAGLPAVPVQTGSLHRGAGRRLRRRGVPEPVPGAGPVPGLGPVRRTAPC